MQLDIYNMPMDLMCNIRRNSALFDGIKGGDTAVKLMKPFINI